MGIFTRVRDILNSNINAALDKAEDPEKLVKQMIREMEDTLVEIKAACAGAMAAKKRAERDCSRLTQRSAHWDSRAAIAVDHGREDLAREALRAKHRHDEEVDVLGTEVERLDEIVARYKDDIAQIETKLGTARERERVLVQRHIHAAHKTRAEREIRRLDTSGALVRFESFEGRIDIAEAQSELVNFGRPTEKTLEEQFVEMERDEEIEKELEELKSKRREERLVTA